MMMATDMPAFCPKPDGLAYPHVAARERPGTVADTVGSGVARG